MEVSAKSNDERGLAPICFQCAHYVGIKPGVGFTCKAFGGDTAIPIEIIVSAADHTVPYKDDNGVTFKPMKKDTSLATDPPVSEAQRRFMWARMGGAKEDVPMKVAREFTKSDPGGKLPARARDMSGNDWKVLRWLLNKFFSEESQEEEHQEEPQGDGLILSADECVEQIRNLVGEFRKAKPARDTSANDSVVDPDRRVEGEDPKFRHPPDPDKSIEERAGPSAAEDHALAHDEMPWPLSLAEDKEKDPQRKTDDAGHMHVRDTVLSRAVVSPYQGKEINEVMRDEPGWQMLDPEKTYHLLRDPKELEKSVDTWNGKPLLWVHKGVTAEDHPTNLVIGSTGTNAHVKGDELINDLAIWPKFATQAIEGGEKKSLSCGYGYSADMSPGTYKGQHYDGVMRNLSGNHVALVDKPRVPGAKVAGDMLPDNPWERIAAAIRMVA